MSLKLQQDDVFPNEREAHRAFVEGRLEWHRFAEAYVYRTTTVGGERNVTGHDTVRILDVQSISPTGQPIYACETDDGRLLTIEARELFTERELMCKPDGTPSDYARWMAARMERKRQRQAAEKTAAATGRLPPVTVKIIPL